MQWKKRKWKGTEAFPSSFIMSQENIISSIEALANEVIGHTPSVFLVSVKIKPTNNIRVYMDADDGLSIDKCVKINRSMYKLIEERGWYPDGDFSLEVSSPGIDEPLKLLRQYQKNVGRKVEVVLKDESKKEGKLVAVTEATIQLEITTGKNKKAVTVQQEIAFEDIKQTKVQIVF